MDDIKHLVEDISNADILPEDDKRLGLLDQVYSNLVPGALIGWYYKDNVEHWEKYCDNQPPPTDAHECPYLGIVVPTPGTEWRGGCLETEHVVIAHHVYPTEKCYPDTQWLTLHRLLDDADLAGVLVSRSAEPPIQGPIGPPCDCDCHNRKAHSPVESR